MLKLLRAVVVGLSVDCGVAKVLYIPVAVILTLILTHGAPSGSMNGNGLAHSLPFALLAGTTGLAGHLAGGYVTISLDPGHRFSTAWMMIALRFLLAMCISAFDGRQYPLWIFVLSWMLGLVACWLGARFYLSRAAKSQLKPVTTVPPIAAP